VKHYGPEPPWRTETRYGRWVWVPPSPDDWFGGPGYWELRDRRSLGQILMDQYLPRLTEALNRPTAFIQLLQSEG
jgi:hypothetical protein